MNTLDFIIIVLALWGGILGYKRGFFREAASFLGLVIGIFLAIMLSDIAGRVLEGMVDWNPMPVKVFVFLVTFILVVMALWAVGNSLTRLFKIIMLNLINRLAGFAFGVLKTTLLLSVTFYFIRLLNDQWKFFSDLYFDNSILYNMLEGLAPWLFITLSIF